MLPPKRLPSLKTETIGNNSFYSIHTMMMMGSALLQVEPIIVFYTFLIIVLYIQKCFL